MDYKQHMMKNPLEVFQDLPKVIAEITGGVLQSVTIRFEQGGVLLILRVLVGGQGMVAFVGGVSLESASSYIVSCIYNKDAGLEMKPDKFWKSP